MDVVANFRCVRAQRCEEIRMLPLAHPSIPPTCIIICYMNLNALLFYEPKYSQCLSSCGAIFFHDIIIYPKRCQGLVDCWSFRLCLCCPSCHPRLCSWLPRYAFYCLPCREKCQVVVYLIPETNSHLQVDSTLPFFFICTLNFCIIFLLNLN